MLFTIKNIGFGDVFIAAARQNRFYAVLNIFNRYQLVFNFRLKIRSDHNGQKVDDAAVIVGRGSVKRFFHRVCNFFNLEIDNSAVAFHNPIHSAFSLVS